MDTTISQAVALVSHANAALRGSELADFPRSSSTTTFCETISFSEIEPGPNDTATERVVAADPAAWFALLRQRGAKYVLLHEPYGARSGATFRDRLVARLSGANERWLLEVVDGERSGKLWAPSWDVHNPKAADRRIWRVSYTHIGERAPSEPPSGAQVAEAYAELERAVSEIARFARAQKSGFANLFEAALKALQEQTPDSAFHKDLAPPGTLGAAAAALLCACQHAYVFGGMGSWNDQYFDGDVGDEYERTTRALFESVRKSIAIAASSSAS